MKFETYYKKEKEDSYFRKLYLVGIHCSQLIEFCLMCDRRKMQTPASNLSPNHLVHH